LTLILDIFLLLFAAVFIVFGYKKGFIESTLGFLRSILSMLIATYLSSVLAEFVYNNFMKEALIAKILKNLDGNGPLSSENFLKAFPPYFSNLLPHFGITNEKLKFAIDSYASEGVQNAVSNLFAPIYIYAIRAILFAVLSTLFYVVFWFFRRSLRKIFKIAVLSQINAICGAILGFLEYVIFIILLLTALKLVLPLTDPPDILSDASINKTLIFKEIYYNNPLLKFFDTLSFKNKT
jgi:uncharacterized membrane protein required for colicin V production